MRALLPLLLILSGCAAQPEKPVYCVGWTDYCTTGDGPVIRPLYRFEDGYDEGTKL